MIYVIVDLNKNILVPFITSFVRHPGKTKLDDETTIYCSSEYKNSSGTPAVHQLVKLF